MKRITVFILAVLMVLSLGMFVLADDYAISKKPQGKHGGTLITPLLTEPASWNPIVSRSKADRRIFGYIFESLFTPHGVTTEITPVLAKNWEFSNNDLTITIHLREDVQWNDGEPFTAEDVIFTLDVIYDENVQTTSRRSMTFADQPVQYQALDQYTVQLDLPTPAPSIFTSFPVIIPKHKLYDIWKSGKLNETWGVDTPIEDIVGTGPFKIAQYKPGERVIMSANEYYWRKDPQGKSLPYIKLWVREIVDNQETQALKFENGEIHWIDVQPVDYERMLENAEAGNYTLYNGGPQFNTLFATFNMNPRNPNLEREPWKLEWFTNLHFRRAVAFALDKQTMINQVYAGLGSPQWSFISAPNQFYLNEDLPTYPFDLQKAREELKAGGFSWNDQGELIDQNGRVVEFILTTGSGNLVREGCLNIIINDLSKLGMKVHPQAIDFNKVVSQLMSEFNWDLILIGITGGIEPNSLASIWQSNGKMHMWNPGQKSPATEWEVRLDELFDLGATTMNPEKRREYYNEAQEIVASQVPVIYTVTRNALVAVRNTVQNVEFSAYGGLTWNIEEIYLSE